MSVWVHVNTRHVKVIWHCFSIITFCVSRRRRKMYCGHAHLCVCMCVCLSVCLSVRGRMPTLLHGPGCNFGSGRGCPLFVHYWADLQSVHGLRCYGNIMRTLVTSLRPSCDMMTQCERSAGRWPAGDGGILNITAVAWTAGFQWWHSGDVARMQNVSKYMLVLAVCLVLFCADILSQCLLCLQ